MKREERLAYAGIPIHNIEGVPFGCLFNALTINSMYNLRPNSYGDFEERVRRMGRYLGLPHNTDPLVVAASHFSSDTDIESIFLQVLREEDRELVPVARHMKTEAMRNDFIRLVDAYDERIAFEAMDALAEMGISEREKQALVHQVKKDDMPRRLFAIAVLAETGTLETVVAEGHIDEVMDSDTITSCMVDFALAGSLEALDSALHQSSHWAEHVSLQRCVHGLPTYGSLELLEILLEHCKNAEYNETMTVYAWSIGMCVRQCGYVAAEAVLRFCLDQHGNNDNLLCFIINAALRYVPTEEERDILLDILNQIVSDDTDVQRSVYRVREMYSGNVNPVNWLFRGGYGRGIDLYEPRQSIVPDVIREVLCPTKDSNPSYFLSYLSNVGSEDNIISLLASVYLHVFPDLLPVYIDALFRDILQDSKKGIAAALLCTNLEHDVSPLMLRCLAGAEVGGPVKEDETTFASLIAMQREWQMQDAATSLMLMGSEKIRTQFAHYCQSYLLHNDDQGVSENMYKTGILLPPKQQYTKPPVLWEFATKKKVHVSYLKKALQGLSKEDIRAAWQSFQPWFNDLRREEMQTVCMDTELWGMLDVEFFQETLETMLFHRNSYPNQGGCTVARVMGAKSLEGKRGKRIANRLLALCNDSNSDTQEKAQHACSVLKLEVVIINPETLRSNILNGTDLGTWSERLFDYITAGEDIGDIRSVVRVAPLWNAVGLERTLPRWFEWASSDNWIHREVACIIVGVFGEALLGSDEGQNVYDRVRALAGDDDGDVSREAKIACDSHAIDYT